MTEIKFKKATTLVIEMTYTDEDGDPVNITGFKFIFTVKAKTSDSDTSAIIKKEVTSHTNALGGITQIVCNPGTETDQTTKTPGQYVGSVRVINTVGEQVFETEDYSIIIEQNLNSSVS